MRKPLFILTDKIWSCARSARLKRYQRGQRHYKVLTGSAVRDIDTSTYKSACRLTGDARFAVDGGSGRMNRSARDLSYKKNEHLSKLADLVQTFPSVGSASGSSLKSLVPLKFRYQYPR